MDAGPAVIRSFGRQRIMMQLSAVAVLVVVVGGLGATPADAATGKGKLLGYRILEPGRGGHVRGGGARLYVPKLVLQRETLVTIARLSNGRLRHAHRWSVDRQGPRHDA